MTAMRRTLVLFGVTAAAAVTALAGAAAFSHDDDSGTPEHTVRDFLVSAVAEHDGSDACGFLTRHTLLEVQAAEPRGMSCVTALSSSARLTLGRETVDTEAEVKALSYRAEPEAGNRSRVTVSAHGDSRTFVLRRATRRELVEFAAPSTPWRIDSGIRGLLAQ
jgi:hypothetical protein